MDGKQLQKKRRMQLIAVDRKLDYAVLTTMTNGFMTIGVIAFLAFGFALTGLLFHTNTQLIPGNALNGGDQTYWTRFEFAEYGGWDSFVSHCCCRRALSYGSYEKVELWTCLDGRMKERIRMRSGVDGTNLRPMCSRTFSPGVTGPVWSSSHRRYVVWRNGQPNPIVDNW